MALFNENSRKKNALRTSGAGMIYQVVKILSAFAYRTLFLMVLTKEHLGINGLFSNVLQIFSLAELGIGSAIIYRMYLPFGQKDREAIGALLRFYQKVYRAIALIVAIVAVLMFPFIRFLVNVEEIPPDVNFVLVYVLFVAQSVSSYFFVYKQSLLSADQRGHTLALYSGAAELLGYAVKIGVLWVTRSYVLVLACGIAVSVLCNFLFSKYIDWHYREILDTESNLEPAKQKGILMDTLGLMCHKIGYVVVNGTDNLVLSKCVGLAAVGLYSNYYLITASLATAITGISSGLVPIVGNLVVTEEKEDSYKVYLHFLGAGMWVAGMTTVCLFVLLNPFIETWKDASYLFGLGTVAVLCAQYFIQISRLVTNVFINACGLFMRDKARPIFESVINLVVSIVLVLKIGVAGVFVGTVVSGLATYYWREPYLLLKDYFHKSGREFCRILGTWVVLTVAAAVLFTWICGLLPMGWAGFFLRAIVCFAGTNMVFLILMCRTESFRFFLRKIAGRLKRG